jgi:hypothetical protein
MAEKLERSILLVPASNWNMIQKTAASNADAVCIDLEDAVTVDEKEASRANVVRAYKELDFGNKLRMYRINGLDTHYAYRDLIEVVEAAGDGIDLIVVPKVNRPEDVYVVETLLTQIESYRQFSRPIGIEALIETAAGLRQHPGNRGLFHPAGRISYTDPAITRRRCGCRWNRSENWTTTTRLIPAIAGTTSCIRSSAPPAPITSAPSTGLSPASRIPRA